MSQNDNKTIAEKLTELDAQVAWFDSEEFALEDAIDKFSEAEKLAKDIEDRLVGLKNKINVLKQDFSKE